ncbi:FAD-dependent oxidoreductase [Arthrobacter sp. zg-Y179]|uniref:FAD-dependent oxidoreductase n=1 Tax=Arthrobacter sp. zg-Y179 TaxID=2894188 RepID=UPI001E4C1893|nr:FAD-dependent oxidoreductase [Arthrobacter sp. zg-Y179]MCC9174418.1 FAD-dependent oxidoreductase [Arthrobacter sp. zg-Y179]
MEEVDVVVVGAGTGMFAALAAAHHGMSALVVEKSPYVGGSTSLSGGGFWIPGNSVLEENGQKEDPERIQTYLREATRGEVEDERWQTHIDAGRATVDLLRSMTPLKFQFMTEYADYFPELPGGSATGRACEPKPFDAKSLGADRALLREPKLKAPFPMPITSRAYKWLNLVARSPKGVLTGARQLGLGVGGMALGREYLAGGQALAAGLLAGLRKAGVPIWTESPLEDLIVEDGRVTGVVVERDGRKTSVRARRGVILATGGFDRNAGMRHEFQSPYVDGSWSFGAESNTGDVISIARNHGADLAFMDAAWWFPAVPAPGPMPGALLAERSLPGQIIVNGSGRRFMNEAVNYMTAGQIITSKHSPEDPHIPAWLIFDQRYRNRYLFGGGIFPRQPLPKAWYEAGIAKQEPTLEKLASSLGMAELPATVERFNSLARAGRDDDFGRGDSAYDRYYGDPTISPNPCLGPIDAGPYYAVQVVPGDLGTCGGVRADANGQALATDGTPIPGLYAIGNAAGNAFGRVYPGPGATIGQGLTFGYAAARNLADVES